MALDLAAGLINQATAAVTISDDTIELNGLKGAGLPDFVADWLQQQRKGLGWKPITNPAQLFVIGMACILVFVGIIGILIGIIQKILGIYVGVLTGKTVPKWQVIFFCLSVGFFISYALYYLCVQPILKASKINVQSKLGEVFGEAFQNPVPQTSLINLQSVAVKQAAYMGPENDGLFDPLSGIQSVLNTGTRFFTLQISYLEAKKDSKKFDSPYVPTLVYRDDAGKLISANGAAIKDVVKTLADYAFAPSVKSSSQPLIVYLHFERTPNQLRTPEKYVKFLSSVAEMLEPLEQYMVQQKPEGSFKRQQNELTLLNSPISLFEKTALIFCNVDTSIFRNLEVLGMETVNPKQDLDFFVNLRVYLDNKSDTIGATSAPLNGQTPTAVIIPFNRLDTFNSEQEDAFAIQGKARYVIAMPGQMGNPSLESIKTAIDKCGVNSIPMNLFGEDISILTEKIKVWEGEPFYKMKPTNYRAVSFEPIGVVKNLTL